LKKRKGKPEKKREKVTDEAINSYLGRVLTKGKGKKAYAGKKKEKGEEKEEPTWNLIPSFPSRRTG